MSVEVGSGGSDVDAGVCFLEALFGDQCESGAVLKLSEAGGAAGDHGGFKFGDRQCQTFVEVTGVGNVPVDAFFERQSVVWLSVALPVVGTIGNPRPSTP